jgi:hypothetical protein
MLNGPRLSGGRVTQLLSGEITNTLDNLRETGSDLKNLNFSFPCRGQAQANAHKPNPGTTTSENQLIPMVYPTKENLGS